MKRSYSKFVGLEPINFEILMICLKIYYSHVVSTPTKCLPYLPRCKNIHH